MVLNLGFSPKTFLKLGKKLRPSPVRKFLAGIGKVEPGCVDEAFDIVPVKGSDSGVVMVLRLSSNFCLMTSFLSFFPHSVSRVMQGCS